VTQRTSLYAEESHKSPALAAVLSFVLPGLGQIYAGRVLRGLVIGIPQTIAVIAFVWIFATRGAVATSAQLAVNGGVVAVLLVLLLVFRTWSVLDAYWIAAQRSSGLGGSRQRVAASVVALVLLLTINAGVLGYGAYNSYLVGGALNNITGNKDCNVTDDEIRPRDCPTPSGPAATPPPTLAPGQTPTPEPTLAPGQTATPLPTAIPTTPAGTPYWAEDGRLDILLLGVDSAPGGSRSSGLRTDTMIVASMDIATGRTALFGIPRNVYNAPLPDDMTSTWQCHCIAGFLFGMGTYVGEGRIAFVDGDTNKFRAVTHIIEHLLGLEMDGTVMVDLQGFVRVVDALGGVTINITERVVETRYHDENNEIGSLDLKPGIHHLDGHTALAYVRTREQDSDYGRMGRQQNFLRAVRAQFTACNLLPRLPDLISAVGGAVRTDVPLDQVSVLIELVSRSKQPRRFEFTPLKGYNADWSEGGRALTKVRAATGQAFEARPGSEDPAEPEQSLPPLPENPC
jgi:LCP family protein required for cell wall assembly